MNIGKKNSSGHGPWHSSRKISGSSVWGRGDFVHICFESCGCRFRKQGYCMMCDYGAGDNVTETEAVEILDHVLRGRPVPSRLLLGTCGSILDGSEMSRTVLMKILQYLQNTDIEYIIFETHYTTVSRGILYELKNMLPGKTVAIEMGFESSNPNVLKHSLHKVMDLGQLKQVMHGIADVQMEIILNVFLGAPGLSVKEQLEDALEAVNWAYGHGAHEVVIFPANIKPGTKLWELYQTGKYERVSHWLLIKLLGKLTEEQLGRTAVSWYGDRQDAGNDLDILPPEACDQCRPVLMEFYRRFMNDFDASSRAALLKEVKSQVSCSCQGSVDEKLYGGV